MNHIDPTGQYFGHDKVEGVALDPSNPKIVYISDDSDFGITDVPLDQDNATPPVNHWSTDKLSAGGTKRVLEVTHSRSSPGSGGQGTGVQDFGEILKVDLTQIPAGYSSES